ncbi:MAG: PQQ-dependent dehydrogenase, methanol/ethanol family, partial [bacterium]
MRLTAAIVFVAAIAASGQDVGWTSYGLNAAGWRFSELNQIDTANVMRLAPQWIFQSRVPGGMETTPLVDGGLMYVTGQSN